MNSSRPPPGKAAVRRCLFRSGSPPFQDPGHRRSRLASTSQVGGAFAEVAGQLLAPELRELPGIRLSVMIAARMRRPLISSLGDHRRQLWGRRTPPRTALPRRCPALRQKTAATGGDLMEFPTRTTRLSRGRRLHEEAPLPAGLWLGDGSGVVQRDCCSAFLAHFVEADTLDARNAAEAFRSATPMRRRESSTNLRAGWASPHPRTLWRVRGLPVEEKRRRRGRKARAPENARQAGLVALPAPLKRTAE